jgi:CubicO group peptidase (beta-lactamase class C family)
MLHRIDPTLSIAIAVSHIRDALKRKRLSLLFCATCALLLHVGNLPGQERPDNPVAERFQPVHELLADHVEREQIAGAVALVMERGRVVYRDAVGWRDVASREPMTQDTIFRIASMTKPITTVAVMMLVEEGRLSLDDPLSKYIPEFAHPMVVPVGSAADARGVPADRVITIRDLLTHTSGITYRFFGQQPHAEHYREAGVIDGLQPTSLTLAEDMRRLATCPLTNQPGTAWQYGLSADVLGRVVEVVSGRPLDEFFRERILGPLHMDDTYFFLPADKVDRLATLYRPGDDGRFVAVGEETQNVAGLTYSPVFQQQGRQPYLSGGGGLVSTADDYARFLTMLLNRGEFDGVRFLKPETVASMTTNRIGDLSILFTIHGDKFGYGFGIHTENSDRHGASIGTWGWGGIFYTYFWVDPKREVIGIVLTQIFPFNHLTLLENYQQRVYDALDTNVEVVR